MYKKIISILITCVFIYIKPALATTEWPDIANLMLSDKLQWHDHQTMLNNGVPIAMSEFSSDLQPVAIAALISNSSNLFQRVLAQHGQVVLSGINNGWHWLANINATANGSAGYISALQSVIDVNMPDSASNKTIHKSNMRLPSAPKLLDNSFQANGYLVHQQIFKYGHSASTTYQILIKHLQLQGWVAVKQEGGNTSYKLWRRGAEQLTLELTSNKNATYVLVQHINKHT